MKPLGEVIRQFGVGYHQYADDTQLYISIPGQAGKAAEVIGRCFLAVKDWMGKNRLKLNPGKTEWLWVFGSLDPSLSPVLTLDGVPLPQKEKVRNLGVLLDGQLTLDQQIMATTKSAFARLHLVRQLRPYLDRDSLRTVTHALVTSRLDYCNALYMGLPLKSIRKLQLVQNAAARTIMGLPKSAHVSPLLYELHWLPIQFRVQFKVLVTTFKALHGVGPGYLRDRLSANNSARPTRSTQLGKLKIPSARECHLAGPRAHAFSVAAPQLWNNLPAQLRQLPSLKEFRNELKTLLFRKAFPNY